MEPISEVIPSVPQAPILAVDYGLKRVGLAISDPHGRVAVGAGILVGLTGRALARAVMVAARERNAKSILVGEPPEGAREVEEVIAGANKLSEYLASKGFPVYRIDEDYTTAVALASRKAIGGKGKRTKKWIDEAAAIIILQRFLDS